MATMTAPPVRQIRPEQPKSQAQDSTAPKSLQKYVLLKGAHRQLNPKTKAIEVLKAGDHFESDLDLVVMLGREHVRLANENQQSERVVEKRVFVTESSVDKMSLADLKDFADAEEVALPEDCLQDQKKAAAFLKARLRGV